MSPEEINALPPRVRDYIHDLETNCDPQFIISQNIFLRDQIAGLQKMYRSAVDQLELIKKEKEMRTIYVSEADGVQFDSASDCRHHEETIMIATKLQQHLQEQDVLTGKIVPHAMCFGIVQWFKDNQYFDDNWNDR